MSLNETLIAIAIGFTFAVPIRIAIQAREHYPRAVSYRGIWLDYYNQLMTLLLVFIFA